MKNNVVSQLKRARELRTKVVGVHIVVLAEQKQREE